MKLCKDCKHFIDESYPSFTDRCGLKRDPVYGVGLPVREVRFSTECGPDGKAWEPAQ